MKSEYLIVSDTHGKTERLLSLVRRCTGLCGVIFLGDGEAQVTALAEAFPDLSVTAVRGNCDLFSDLPQTRLITLRGHRLLVTHGHAYGVKMGLTRLAEAAAAQGAEAALFGHTHLPLEQRVFPTPEGASVLLFNPGSLGLPREGAPQFGRLAIDEQEMLFSHGTLPPGEW